MCTGEKSWMPNCKLMAGVFSFSWYKPPEAEWRILSDNHLLYVSISHDVVLKASFNNAFTFKKILSYMSLHAISVFDKV